MITVAELMKEKASEIWHIGPDRTVYDALVMMNEKGVGALLVLENGELAGVFSERDYARKIELEGRTARDTKVREIMVKKIYCISPEKNLESCLSLMTDKRIRHVPVIEGKKLVGLVSIGDVVKHIISDQKHLIEHLEHVISWGESY